MKRHFRKQTNRKTVKTQVFQEGSSELITMENYRRPCLPFNVAVGCFLLVIRPFDTHGLRFQPALDHVTSSEGATSFHLKSLEFSSLTTLEMGCIGFLVIKS